MMKGGHDGDKRAVQAQLVPTYHHEISVMRILGEQPADEPIRFVANVSDKFGKIRYVNLTYDIVNLTSEKQGKENLIWGAQTAAMRESFQLLIVKVQLLITKVGTI
jgi:hypothetical protein